MKQGLDQYASIKAKFKANSEHLLKNKNTAKLHDEIIEMKVTL